MKMIETVDPSEAWMGHVPGRGNKKANPEYVMLWETALKHMGQYCIFDVPEHPKPTNADWIKGPRSFLDQRAHTRGLKASVRLDPRNHDRFGVCLRRKEDAQ